ncbi:SDR family oxidoreductase [Haladaptatus sp. CMAA 1911]|uniref:SDR family oxidoreductase n=1 Tax=unclassified Haladaptatus TaxID=2622732 RepID=UPI00375533F8
MSTESFGILDGQVAIVTGASSGSGAATAKALAEQGANVVLAARRESELKTVAKEIETTGATAIVIPTDMTDEADIDTLVQSVRERFETIDILVNNAGIALIEPVERAHRSNVRQMIEVNLLGVMNLTTAVLPVMQEQDAGHIVTVSSTAGRTASANMSGYNASKFGVNGFTEALRQEVTTQGIRTTLIEPGAVDTEFSSHIPDNEVRSAIEDRLFTSIKPLQPEDIARSIVFAVTQPQHVSVNEILIRPTDQQ